jgi:hypothetical protein
MSHVLVPSVSNTYRAVAFLTLPRWFTLLEGPLYEQCAVTITLGTLPESAYQ